MPCFTLAQGCTVIKRAFYAPLGFWRMQHGKSVTLVACALACLYTGHLFFFNVLLFISLWVYGFEL